jgi:hypothetical protein
VAKGTPTAKFGSANCVCDGVSHGCPAAMKSDDQRVCDPRGLARTPSVCMRPYQHQDQQGGGPAYLPSVFGGPSTLGNCAFGHFGEGGYGGGGSCWTGSLFGFSGIDGTTSVASEFVGWFVNGSNSVYLSGGQAAAFSSASAQMLAQTRVSTPSLRPPTTPCSSRQSAARQPRSLG